MLGLLLHSDYCYAITCHCPVQAACVGPRAPPQVSTPQAAIYTLILEGHLINLQLAQALILGIFFGHGFIRSTTWQEWPHSLSYQHTTFTELESCMMPDLESNVQEVGLVSKSVEANASSDSQESLSCHPPGGVSSLRRSVIT